MVENELAESELMNFPYKAGDAFWGFAKHFMRPRRMVIKKIVKRKTGIYFLTQHDYYKYETQTAYSIQEAWAKLNQLNQGE